MRTTQKHSLDFIPVKRKPNYASYDNKPLGKWNSDNFADYVFDHCNSKGQFIKEGTFIKDNDSLLDYLENIPESFARVYLYGVHLVFQSLQKSLNKLAV